MLARDATGKLADPRVIALLSALAAREPSKAEEMALRACARGHGSSGQQKMAMKYALELGGAGDLMFDPASERVTSFRLGSQAVAQTLAALAGAAWLSFREQSDGAEADMSEGAERGR